MSAAILNPDIKLDDGFLPLLQKIETEKRLRCASYKERCVRRRISVRLRATGLHSFNEYSELLDRAPGEWEKLLATLTINVTEFFRDASAFGVLEHDVLPLIAETFNEPVVAWSAGCSHGHEAYSIAMLLAERFGVSRFRIDATDIDAESLNTATEACYDAAALDGIPTDRRKRWVRVAAGGGVVPVLRSQVTVFRHDLLRDSIPEQRYHLISCRNAIIYFSRDAQTLLFDRLFNALIPGGFLMLGKVETLTGPARAKFQSFNVRERLFRRPLA